MDSAIVNQPLPVLGNDTIRFWSSNDELLVGGPVYFDIFNGGQIYD